MGILSFTHQNMVQLSVDKRLLPLISSSSAPCMSMCSMSMRPYPWTRASRKDAVTFLRVRKMTDRVLFREF